MPKINVTGAYAYLGKDIGFDFNEMKGPPNLAGQLLGSGLTPERSSIGLLNPLLNADWFLTLQAESGVRGRRGDHADLAGR